MLAARRKCKDKSAVAGHLREGEKREEEPLFAVGEAR